jgi:hypothetical protein
MLDLEIDTELQKPIAGFRIETIPLDFFPMFTQERAQRAICNPAVPPDFDPSCRDP